MDLSKLYTNGQSPPKGSCSSTVNFCGWPEMSITTIPSVVGGECFFHKKTNSQSIWRLWADSVFFCSLLPPFDGFARVRAPMRRGQLSYRTVPLHCTCVQWTTKQSKIKKNIVQRIYCYTSQNLRTDNNLWTSTTYFAFAQTLVIRRKCFTKEATKNRTVCICVCVFC